MAVEINNITVIDDTKKGIFQKTNPGVYTTAQRDALSASEGDVIYNSDDKALQVYSGTEWIFGAPEPEPPPEAKFLITSGPADQVGEVFDLVDYDTPGYRNQFNFSVGYTYTLQFLTTFVAHWDLAGEGRAGADGRCGDSSRPRVVYAVQGVDTTLTFSDWSAVAGCGIAGNAGEGQNGFVGTGGVAQVLGTPPKDDQDVEINEITGRGGTAGISGRPNGGTAASVYPSGGLFPVGNVGTGAGGISTFRECNSDNGGGGGGGGGGSCVSVKYVQMREGEECTLIVGTANDSASNAHAAIKWISPE